MRARIYLDGFNLPRRVPRGTPFKYLNTVSLTEMVRVYRLFIDRNNAMTGTTVPNFVDLLYGWRVRATCIIRSTAATNLGRS